MDTKITATDPIAPSRGPVDREPGGGTARRRRRRRPPKSDDPTPTHEPVPDETPAEAPSRDDSAPDENDDDTRPHSVDIRVAVCASFPTFHPARRVLQDRTGTSPESAGNLPRRERSREPSAAEVFHPAWHVDCCVGVQREGAGTWETACTS